jgi:hypothetical protein
VRDFHGVYLPLPTPFRGGDVAIERLKSNLAPCRALGTPDGDGIEEIKESLASAGLLQRCAGE